MLTNALVPCNGRFPTLIAIITMFFATSVGIGDSAISALILTGTILLSVLATFGCSKLLSLTVLKGTPSSFTLELPPYRRPEIGKVILRSVLDRTLFVLGRAVAVAAPAGLILWILANVSVGETGLLSLVASYMDPLGRIFGMDGVILLAFLLALPANEIVFPIILMAYTSAGSLIEYENLWELKGILLQNGWTETTALCTLIFVLFHFPCSTTLMTIKKESGSWRWTVIAAVLPTVLGLTICFLISSVTNLLTK